MRYLLAFLLALSATSCTMISSKNLPGKKADSFPSKLVGKYELVLPAEYASMLGEAKVLVEFTKNKMILDNNGERSETMLNDSIFYSQIGKTGYLSLGAEPELTVFKVVFQKNEVQLYPLLAAAQTSGAALMEYFVAVEEVPGEPNESGEPGVPSYSVTIDDKKLEKFFSSSVAYNEIFLLKKVK